MPVVDVYWAGPPPTAPDDMAAALADAIGDALQRRGYRTAMIGKWHLGDFIKAPQFHPMEHGFQSFYGVPHSNDMTPFPLYRDRETIEAEITDRTKLTRLYTDEAIKVVESSKDKPFFLYFAHYTVHTPLKAKAETSSGASGLYFSHKRN